MVCVGETLAQRKQGATFDVIERQVSLGLALVDPATLDRLVIAYEPVWAIGTGDAASGEDAQDAAVQVRAILAESDRPGADEVPVLYGGSCTPENAAEFFTQPDIDGALVGGASLDAARFAAIVRIAAEARA